MIVGVLASVAITRFVTTRTDSAVATLRSDASVAQKAIVGKVFADNLITTSEKAPAPNDPQKKYTMEWGEWIMEISGIDKKRWVKPPAVAINADRGISPASNLNTLAPCGVRAMIEILKDGDLHFNPIALTTDGDSNAPSCAKN